MKMMADLAKILLFVKDSPIRQIISEKERCIAYLCQNTSPFQNLKNVIPELAQSIQFFLQMYKNQAKIFTFSNLYLMKTKIDISCNLGLSSYTFIILQMQIRKTFSHTESHMVDPISVQLQNKPQTQHSQNTLSMLFKTRQRVPAALQSTLRSKISQERSNKAQDQDNKAKKSKMASVLRSRLKNALQSSKESKQCQICEGEIPKLKNKNFEVYMCDCEHKQNFCQSCLHHYVIYKVKTFEEVHCPHEGCQAVLNVNTIFFKQLPLEIQKGYRKLSQFYLAAKNPDLKMCPKENCQGILKTTIQNVMVCSTCQNSCCAKCLLAMHEGECDSHQVKFFQSNLHYRQCKKCKFIIQKNQGCNHMTCRCGKQFCYVCGDDWTPAHYGNHDENGQLIPGQGQAVMPAAEPCCECACLNECCGQCCASILKAPFKLLLCLLFLVLMLFIFASRDLLVMVGVTLVCIFAGLFGFSFEVLSNLDGFLCVLGLLFFPVVMIFGVGVAFREIFCDVVPNLCQEYWQIFCDGLTGICQI